MNSSFHSGATTRSLKDCFVNEETLRGPYHDLKAFTETIQRKLGMTTSNLRSGIPPTLDGFFGERLFSRLLIVFRGAENPLGKPPEATFNLFKYRMYLRCGGFY